MKISLYRQFKGLIAIKPLFILSVFQSHQRVLGVDKFVSLKRTIKISLFDCGILGFSLFQVHRPSTNQTSKR